MNLITGFLGSLIEARSELRVHRTRVLLSLIGVGVAVAALTGVLAAGAITTQIQVEQSERFGGRPALVGLSAFNPDTGQAPGTEAFSNAVDAVAERYEISYVSASGYSQLSAQLPDGVVAVSAQLVDQPYGVMRRIRPAEGTWFTERDTQRLAPALVISNDLWVRLGSPDLRTNPTLDLVAQDSTTVAVIIGVLDPMPGTEGFDLSLYLLTSAFENLSTPEQRDAVGYQYEFWLPPDIAAELSTRLQTDVAAELGGGWQVQTWRQDYLASGEDPILVLKLAVTGVALLVLLLGALGLVNIALVTVRHRIREIGIRRAVGATSGRVFFSVLMESVVATAVAGFLGVVLAVILVRNPISAAWIDSQLQDVPPFPLDAALIGLAAAVGVGALAGVLPAMVAVRVKVIDAIRY